MTEELLSVAHLATPPVDRRSPAHDVVHAAITRSVATLGRELPGAVDGVEPEPLHQARVAVRRLRSDLSTFAPLVDADWSRPLRSELGWIGRSLGQVRDLDVLALVIADVAEREDAIDDQEAGELLSWFTEERARSRAQMLGDLGSERFTQLAESLVSAASTPCTTPLARHPARDVMPRLVRRPWRDLRDAVRQLGDEPPDAELHRVRILAKRCRYAADAVQPSVGKPARRFSKGMAEIQTCLGDLNDAVVIGQCLRDAADRSPDQAFVAGQLAGILAQRAAHCRADFPEVWSRAADRSRRGWW